MHVSVDSGLCIGCDLCARLCPLTFSMDGKKAEVRDPLGHAREDVSKVADKCPTGAIRVSHAEWTKHLR
ncbi:MAG: ferredoxin [Candidatus Aenigmatarchaeota archaeon]|nr:MAG: ferredoxin [Candidatus Aenigmarchaeota archaeon]